MDPASLGALACLAVAGVLLALVIARAWVRGMVKMLKLALTGMVLLVVLLGAGAGVSWYLYGDRLAVLFGS